MMRTVATVLCKNVNVHIYDVLNDDNVDIGADGADGAQRNHKMLLKESALESAS